MSAVRVVAKEVAGGKGSRWFVRVLAECSREDS